jgi:hypothetical protein
MIDETLCDYCGKRLYRPINTCCGFTFCLSCWRYHRKTLHPDLGNR